MKMEATMDRQLTCNEDLVKDLLNFSPFGAMGQVFVMEAIRHYSALVVAGDEVGAPINKGVWTEIASDVKRRCDAFYSRHDAGSAGRGRPDEQSAAWQMGRRHGLEQGEERPLESFSEQEKADYRAGYDRGVFEYTESLAENDR